LATHSFYSRFVEEEKDIYNYPIYKEYNRREKFYCYRRSYNKNPNRYNNKNYHNCSNEYYKDKRIPNNNNNNSRPISNRSFDGKLKSEEQKSNSSTKKKK